MFVRSSLAAGVAALVLGFAGASVALPTVAMAASAQQNCMLSLPAKSLTDTSTEDEDARNAALDACANAVATPSLTATARITGQEIVLKRPLPAKLAAELRPYEAK
jgi:predicted lipoprotein with Yx(FWY)xxD motif